MCLYLTGLKSTQDTKMSWHGNITCSGTLLWLAVGYWCTSSQRDKNAALQAHRRFAVIWNAKTLLWRPWYSKLKYIGFYTHEGKSSNFEIGDILGCVVWFAHPKLYYSLAWCHIDDVILWTHPQCYRHFMRGIQQSSFDYHHKGQVTRTCDVSLLFAWTHYSIISHPGDLRRCNTDRLFWHHGKQISISPD